MYLCSHVEIVIILKVYPVAPQFQLEEIPGGALSRWFHADYDCVFALCKSRLVGRSAGRVADCSFGYCAGINAGLARLHVETDVGLRCSGDGRLPAHQTHSLQCVEPIHSRRARDRSLELGDADVHGPGGSVVVPRRSDGPGRCGCIGADADAVVAGG